MDGERTHLRADEAASRSATRTRSASSRSSARPSTARYEPVERDRRRARRAAGASKGSTSRSTSTARRAALIAPFIDPDLEWDFRLPRVRSINASGHKYGLVYPGRRLDHLARRGGPARRPRVQGQLPRRRDADVRAELLAARRAGGRAVLQLPPARIRGLPRVQQSCRDTRDVARRAVRHAGAVRAASPTAASCRCSRSRLRSDIDEYSVYDVSDRLRMSGWLVPAYRMPPRRSKT